MTIEEKIENFSQYMSKGYSGGESGLRCSTCDNKYSGTTDLVQLCPRCQAKETLQQQRDEIVEMIEKQIQIDRYAGAPRIGDNIIKNIKNL